MARAPETGFYFEPISERLALVVEGSPFPSDDHWAWLGDPIDMKPEQAQLLVAVRWPGIDPSTLTVEFDLNFERAVKAKEEADREKHAGVTHLPTEFDVDINQLLTQAEVLRDQVRQMSLQAPSREADEAAEEAVRLQKLIEEAQLLTEPNLPGRVLAVAPAPPQSNALLRGGATAKPAVSAPIEAPKQPIAAEPEASGTPLIPVLVDPSREPAEPKRINIKPRARPRPEPTSGVSPTAQATPKPAASAPRLDAKHQPTAAAAPPKLPEPKAPPEPSAPRPKLQPELRADPKRSARVEPPPAKPEPKPDAPPGKRRPNIRDKR